MHTCVHSSIAHNSRRVEAPNCPSTDEWINKMLQTIEYCLALKSNEVLTRDNIDKPWKTLF